MIITKSETKEKYLKCLIELKLRLDRGEKVSLSKFGKDNKLSASYSTILKKGGIIKKSEDGTITWESIHPNRSMVTKLLAKMAEARRNSEGDRKQVKSKTPIIDTSKRKKTVIKAQLPKEIQFDLPAKKSTIKTNKPRIVKTKQLDQQTTSINLLWGLFKYNKTINKI